MKKLIVTLAAALTLGGTMAYADRDDRMEKRTHRDTGYYNGEMARRTTKDYRLRDGEYRRNGSIFDRRRRDVPPGLAKKPGGMPPGQYKKIYR